MLFNLPESKEEIVEARKADGSEKINTSLKLEKDTVKILHPIRLGTMKASNPEKPEKPRPIKFTVETFHMKNKILKANAEIINRYKRIGYNPYIMRQTPCLVVNPITIDRINSYALFFNCTTVVRASDPMTASS